MPRYRVTMPDGNIYSIDGPDGLSKQEVIAAVQRKLGEGREPGKTTLGGELKEAFKGVVPGAAGLLETAATGAAALLPEEAEMAVRGKAAQLAGAAREAFEAAPGYEESTGRKFGEALGSTAPFFALGPLGVAGRAGALGLGVGAGAGEARQRAEMEGGEEEKGLATAAGAVIGASEAIPVFNFVKRLPRNAQLSILDRIKRGFQAAGEEGAQEAAAQIAQNLVAKGLYKPSQELIESAGEEGAYGAGVGAFIQVLTDMALGRRVRGVQPEPSAEEKLTEKEPPTTAPPGTQAAAREEVTKLTDEKQKVQDVIDEEDEARREREAIQAYEREREQDLTATYDEDTLREAAEAERMAPVDEDIPYMPPAAEEAAAEEPTVEEPVIEEPVVEEPVVEEPVVEEPEYTMRDAALEVFKETGKTNVDTLRNRLAIPLQEAKELRQSLIDEGVLVRRGNTYILQEVEPAPTAEAEEVKDADIRARDIEEVDVGAVGGSDVLPPSRPVSAGQVTAEPAVAAVERVGEPPAVAPAGAESVGPALEDIEAAQEELEAAQTPERPTSIRAAALDFIRETGKADPIRLQQALGIKLSEANALREALIGSGAIVPVQGKRNFYAVFEDLRTAPQIPAREGRIEGESLVAARPEVLQGAPRPARKEAPVDAAAEAAAVAQAQQRRDETRGLVEDVKATIRKLVEAPGTQQYGLNLVGGEARGVTRKKLSPVEVNNAKALGLDREAVAYASNPSDADVRRTLLTALNNKHRELLDRAVALQKLETSNRINRRETTLKNSLFRNMFGSLRDPQLTIKDLVTVEQQLKDGETKLGQRAAPEVAPEQARIAEDDVQFREAVERSKEREAADKEQRKVKRLSRKDRDIGLRFERGKGTGMDADRVYEVANKIASTWKNPPRIFVVQSVSEIPDSLRDRVPSDAKGFYIDGSVFLIGDNFSSDAEIKANLFHESLGHYGIRTIFGRRLRQTLLDIYRTNPAMRKRADEWIKNNSDTYANLGAENERSMAVEEVLAEDSSQGVIKDAGIRAAFNRVAALVRKFLRGMGFQINYSNNDVRQILIEAHDSVTTKRREQVYGDGTIAFERKKAEARLRSVLDVNLTAPRYNSKIGDGVRGALERVGDNLRDAAIGLLAVPHIAEVWQSKLPAVEKLDRIINERGATEMRRREEVATNVTKWFDLSNKYESNPETLDKFFQIANMTTVYQVDPLSTEKGRPGLVTREVLKKPKNDMNGQERAGYDIIKAYDALPADLRTAYKDLREAYKRKGDELFYLMEQRLGKDVVDKLKAKYDSKRLEVYLPLWRSGNYWLTYTDKNDETITSAYASDVDRQRAIEAAKRQGGKDFTTFSRLSEARSDGPPPTGFLGDVIREMEAKGAPKDMIDAVYETFLNYLPAQSIRQQLQSREESYDFKTGTSRYGVFGFEPDVFQAYANVATRMANQLTNLEYAIPFEETMKEIKRQAGGERITEPTLRSVYTNLKKKVEFIRNPEANWFVDKSSYFSYLWYIAGNISSALINTTQLPMVVMPLLGGKYGYDKGFTAMERAMGMYFNGGWDSNNGGKSAFPSDYTFGAAKNLKPRHKRLYDAAVSRSAIRRSTGYEITEAQKSGVKDYTGMGARVTHGLGWVFQNSERFNREVTLLAAFDLAFEKTGDEQKAIEEAIKLVNDAHGPALAEAGPRLFQSGIGKVMFTFKRFAQAQIYLLAKLFNQAFRDADPTTREVARSQLIGIFGSSFLIAGLQGMPLYGAVEFLANLLMGDDDEPYDFTAYVNSKFSETGRKGLLNQMIGADVASRTGFNGLIWREDPRRMSEVGVLTYGLEQALGPAYAAFVNAGRGIELFKEGEYQRSIEAFAPSFIRNGLKAMRIAEEGVRAKDGTPIVEDISKYNVMMQAVGFNPADAAEARERAGFDYKIQKELLNRRGALLDKYYAAWQEDDQEGMDEALDSIAKFNEKNPQRGLRITGSTLIKSIKGRVTRQELSVDGLYMPMPVRSRVQEILEGGS